MTEVENKICELIRTVLTDTWGLKTNDFIKSYCSHFNTIYEAVCNKGFDLDNALNIQDVEELKTLLLN